MAFEKKGLMINLIIVLLITVLVVSMVLLIFREYFTGEDVKWEVCRQSIFGRTNLPDAKFGGLNLVPFKKSYPLKCETQIIRIEKEDLEEDGKAEQIIADAIAACWSLDGHGDYNIFPAKVYGKTTSCFSCARIHMTEEAKDFARKNSVSIDFGGYMKNHQFKDGATYYNYLKEIGKKFSPFDPAFTGEFDLLGNGFYIDSAYGEGPWATEDFHTRDGIVDKGWGIIGKVTLPRYFKIDEGDLIISYSAITTSVKTQIDYIPYIYYYQMNQENVDKELKKTFFQWGLTSYDPRASEKICNLPEGSRA